MKSEDIKVVIPPNIGWLESKLNDIEMDYLWRCIKKKKKNVSDKLAGNIYSSYELEDKNDWFYLNVLKPLVIKYKDTFLNMGTKVPTSMTHEYCMPFWWVNYQKQNEFNPIHDHRGVYSFVVWMKIPFNGEHQIRKKIASHSNFPSVSRFQFQYRNILGNFVTHNYTPSVKDEGRILFFPSQLTHIVYPFLDCDEERISISGNIVLDTSKIF